MNPVHPYSAQADGQILWQRSSRCEVNGSCVEVAQLADGRIGVRDGKLGAASPVLSFGPAQWRSLVTQIGAGRFTIG